MDVCAAIDQKAHDVKTAVLTRINQRRASEAVRLVDVCVVLEQQVHDIEMTVLTRNEERRSLPLPASLFTSAPLWRSS